MSHEISFEKLVSYDAGVTGITIDVEIRIGSNTVQLEAKVITGSTLCVFERHIGEGLGIATESGNSKMISTATDSFRVFGHNVTLITEGFEFDSEIFFAEKANFRRNILGRRGWLDRVIVGINDYDGKLYLSRYNS